jgi:hypothetical protein
MFGAGKAKKPQPATRKSTPDQPVPVWTGVVRFLVWAFFGHSQTEGAAGPRAPVLAAAITCPKAGSRTPAQSAMLADASTNPIGGTRASPHATRGLVAGCGPDCKLPLIRAPRIVPALSAKAASSLSPYPPCLRRSSRVPPCTDLVRRVCSRSPPGVTLAQFGRGPIRSEWG